MPLRLEKVWTDAASYRSRIFRPADVLLPSHESSAWGGVPHSCFSRWDVLSGWQPWSWGEGRGTSRKRKEDPVFLRPSATQVHTQGEHTHAPGLWLKLVWCTLGGTSWRFGNGAGMEQGQTKSQPSFSQVTKHKTKDPGVALGDCDLTRCISQVLFICLEPT